MRVSDLDADVVLPLFDIVLHGRHRELVHRAHTALLSRAVGAFAVRHAAPSFG